MSVLLSMNLHEFELRYRAYTGLNEKFSLGWDEKIILEMTKISDQWQLQKVLQEVSPEELQETTKETYTPFKQQYLNDHHDDKIGEFTLELYIARLEYELKVIKEMWFNSYFLIVADFVRWAKQNSIVVWPWRWSWAWSLLAWVIRITEVDPLPFWLLFERFLNPARISMPDFDIDFEDTLREKVIEYVREKYWADKVSAIGTYMQMAAKAAFKDVARVIGLPFEKSNQISALMPDKMSFLDAVNDTNASEELKSMYANDEKVQQTAELASKLEWNMRQLGVHACGIIIAPDTITTYSPVQYAKETDANTVTQYDGPTLEYIGLLKMDFLWLRNLSVIKNCIKIIVKKYEKEGKQVPEMFSHFLATMSFNPPLKDAETFEKVFQSWDTTWIFQFESEWMRTFLVKLQADRIDDLVAMNALYRPGPMEFIPSYIARKRWDELVTYMSDELRTTLTRLYGADVAEEESRKLTEDLGPIMNLTYGIAVYQEQLMFLVQAMAGFSLAEADLLRRWIWKKKKEVIEQLKKEFIIRWEEYKNYKKETTQYIYEKMIEPAASYSFNKSHSVCYAMIAYQTAYLKAHFPVEFYAALMRSVEEDTDELSHYIWETQSQWILVKQPDINQSFNHVAAIDDYIRLWFFCIKWLWFDIWEKIQLERENHGLFTSLEDFIRRCYGVINKKSFEWLTKSGALDAFGDRKTLLENQETILQRAKSSPTMSGGLFGFSEETSKISFKNTYRTEFMEKLMMEQEVFKAFVSGHPLDGLYLHIKKFSFISQFKGKDSFTGPVVIIWYVKNIQRAKKKWFFVAIEDISGTIEIFMKETSDLKKFDILVISGFKGKSLSVEKMVRTSREKLIQQAWGKYDPEMTVVKAKSLRSAIDRPNYASAEIPLTMNAEDTQTASNTSDITPDDGTVFEEAKEVETIQEPIAPSCIFDIPDTIEKITALRTLLRDNPWTFEIIIWWKTYMVSESARDSIQTLLS